jgi:hypothetical protein
MKKPSATEDSAEALRFPTNVRGNALKGKKATLALAKGGVPNHLALSRGPTPSHQVHIPKARELKVHQLHYS